MASRRAGAGGAAACQAVSMGTVLRLMAGWFFVMLGYSMWSSTMSPYWAGHDAWNLFGAGFFWFAVAVSAWDMAGTARDVWRAARARRVTAA